MACGATPRGSRRGARAQADWAPVACHAGAASLFDGGLAGPPSGAAARDEGREGWYEDAAAARAIAALFASPASADEARGRGWAPRPAPRAPRPAEDGPLGRILGAQRGRCCCAQNCFFAAHRTVLCGRGDAAALAAGPAGRRAAGARCWTR